MSGQVVWLTGLPQSGKSTLAARLQAALAPRRPCVVLDSDQVRAVLGDEEYGPVDRERFYQTLSRLAALLARQGHVVVVAATAASLRYRAYARALAPRYLEVWVRTSLEDCQARDQKGLYARARAGEAPHLPGMGAAYEPPASADVVADGGLDDRALTELLQQIEQAR